MNSRFVLGAVVLALLGGVVGASRWISRDPNGATDFAVPTPTPIGWTPHGGVNGMMPPIPPIKPSRQLLSPAFSPDGRFIALQLAKIRAQDSEFSPVVLDAQSGKVIARGEESGASGNILWTANTQFSCGSYSYTLVPNGGGWKITSGLGASASNSSARHATIARPITADSNREATLAHADLALGWSQLPQSGEGELVASSLQTGQPIPLPAPLRAPRVSNTTRYAAPPLQNGAPRLLAQSLISKSSFGTRVQVWNLTSQKRLFDRPYNSSVKIAWTRDGRFLVVEGFDRPNPTALIEGIDILDAKTGAVRSALSIPRIQNSNGYIPRSEPSVSRDGRFLLTREQQKNRDWRVRRLAIRAIPSGEVVCAFEREREISAQPEFAAHDSRLLVWTFEDTVFIQSWKPSKSPQKLAPRRIKIALNSPMFG